MEFITTHMSVLYRSAGALFHIIKGSLGSGIMTMPYSFMNGGLWTSLVGTIFVGVVYAHCIHIFVSTKKQSTVFVFCPAV